MNIATATLAKQFKELSTTIVPGFTIELKNDNIFEWEIGIIGPPDTIYEGGYFLATMKFPPEYPFQPPDFRFNTPFFHPNIYPDGRLCISILHPPGDDPLSGEKAEERWNPTQSVESILLSIVSLLNDPNCSSPANVDAGVMYRNDRESFNKIVEKQVEESKKDIPKSVQTSGAYQVVHRQELTPDDDFWCDDEDESFGHLTEDDD